MPPSGNYLANRLRSGTSLSSKRRVVNTVFSQPEGSAIIILVGVLNVKGSLRSMTRHKCFTNFFYFTLITTICVDRIWKWFDRLVLIVATLIGRER